MNDIEIIYFNDNEDGEVLAKKLRQAGLNLKPMEYKKIGEADFKSVSILIFDLEKITAIELLKDLSENRLIDENIKLIFTEAGSMDGVRLSEVNVNNFDFINRPVEPRSFSLLLEKTLLVEKYRRMINLISKESESRIEVFEHLLNMKDMDDSDVAIEKSIFLKILDFERKLMQEQLNLNDSIRNIALFRKSEFLAMKDRIRAEEMLFDLRRKELLDANRIINAQESLVDYTSKQLHDAKRILDARETLEELSRTEAMTLHDEIAKLKKLNAEIEEKNLILTRENAELKKRLSAGS